VGECFLTLMATAQAASGSRCVVCRPCLAVCMWQRGQLHACQHRCAQLPQHKRRAGLLCSPVLQLRSMHDSKQEDIDAPLDVETTRDWKDQGEAC
jgi:hypothetical protein